MVLWAELCGAADRAFLVFLSRFLKWIAEAQLMSLARLLLGAAVLPVLGCGGGSDGPSAEGSSNISLTTKSSSVASRATGRAQVSQKNQELLLLTQYQCDLRECRFCIDRWLRHDGRGCELNAR